MDSLFLKIDADENYQFYEKFERLSPLRKKIWKKVVDKSRKYIVFKVRQSKLATWCECSRSAISEAFKLFKEYGWMWLQSTGWKRPKIIEISTSKKQMDLDKKSYFHRVQATYRATLTTSTTKINTSRASSSFEVPLHIERLGISFKNKLKLSLVPENIYNQALETAKYHHAKGMEFKTSIENYVVGTAIRMAEKMKLPMNWKGYYQKMKDYKGC